MARSHALRSRMLTADNHNLAQTEKTGLRDELRLVDFGAVQRLPHDQEIEAIRTWTG